MSTTTSLAVTNTSLAVLWDFVSNMLTTGGLIYYIIGICVLFAAIGLGKRILVSKIARV